VDRAGARKGFVEERTATYNRIRGLMSEFGVVLPQKVAGLRRSIGEVRRRIPVDSGRSLIREEKRRFQPWRKRTSMSRLRVFATPDGVRT
jgi:hypothetical protein